jgi:hypothetical protein
VSALDENGGGAGGREGGGAGGMSLAEEFGIFEDVEGLGECPLASFLNAWGQRKLARRESKKRKGRKLV